MGDNPNIGAMAREIAVEVLAREVHYWRSEAAAMLSRDLAKHTALAERGDERAAIDLRVNQIRPLANALRAALAGETFPAMCDPCGKPILVGQHVIMFEDIGEAHFCCDDPTKSGVATGEGEEGKPVEQASYPFVDLINPDFIADTLAKAEALGAEDEAA